VSPEVITYPSGVMNVKLGGIFQITCEPKGVPYPAITWRHNNKIVTNTDQNSRRLTIEVKHYDMGGPIECVADNKVGEPASSGIFLLVNCMLSF
jgi:Immunoglobulin domain